MSIAAYTITDLLSCRHRGPIVLEASGQSPYDIQTATAMRLETSYWLPRPASAEPVPSDRVSSASISAAAGSLPPSGRVSLPSRAIILPCEITRLTIRTSPAPTPPRVTSRCSSASSSASRGGNRRRDRRPVDRCCYLPREVFFGRLGFAGAFFTVWATDFGRFLPATSDSLLVDVLPGAPYPVAPPTSSNSEAHGRRARARAPRQLDERHR